jgi:hypothetical protein
LVVCAAGGAELVRERLVRPLLGEGWMVAVTLTPAVAEWFTGGEDARLEAETGLPVRSRPRLPGQPRPHPPVDLWAVVPATANTVAHLALGLAPNQGLTQVSEAMGSAVPVVVFPRVNAAHARHPAWASHLQALEGAGVHLVYGDDVWPLHEPHAGEGRELPWAAILHTIREALAGNR